LPTTTRSSEPRSSPVGRRWASAGACLAALGLFCGCIAPTAPEEFFQLSADAPKHRAAQTRFFETSDEDELLSASAAVLQDLGFQVEESVPEVGLLRAAKERSARQYGQGIARFIIALVSMAGIISGSNTLILIPVDLHQKIAAAMTTRPVNPDASRHEVRIMFYRVVWKGDGSSGDTHIPPGQQKMEMIRDPEIYQQFFAKLSKAVFLEAHKI
jgi:hypothetical protein